MRQPCAGFACASMQHKTPARQTTPNCRRAELQSVFMPQKSSCRQRVDGRAERRAKVLRPRNGRDERMRVEFNGI
jgi:hypothetical protein